MAKGRRRGVARRSSAPKTKTIVRWRTRGTSAPRKKRRGRGRRKSTGKAVAAAVGSVAAGAAIGALANEAGLLYAVPTQNKTGVSLIGWIGLGLTATGLFFAKRESTKLLTYGLGGGLLTTEVVRQIDMRGYDVEVALGRAPAITKDPTPPQLNSAAEDELRNGLKIDKP